MSKVGLARALGAFALFVAVTAALVPQAIGARSATIQSVAAQVPAAYKQKGTITVAADATYAPNEFIASDGKTVVGMDADLAHGDRVGDGAEGEGRERDLRHDHPGHSAQASTTSACRRSPTRRRARRSSTS